MGWAIGGRLTASEVDPSALGEHRVEVFFRRKPPARPARSAGKREAGEDAPTDTPIEGLITAATDRQGKFEVTLPDRSELASDAIRIVVSAPSGLTISQTTYNKDDFKSPVTIAVEPSDVEPIVLKRPKDLPAPRTRRITGQVIQRNGKPIPANVQVSLFGRKGSGIGTGPDGIEVPVLVARADRLGNFFGDAPNERYEGAAATVSGVEGEIPIVLQDGLIPSRPALVVDIEEAPEAGGEDAGCSCESVALTPRAPSHEDLVKAPETYSVDLGTGGCVQFNTPNRAIEEFNFYTVVRTTEPVIRGLTVGTVPLHEIEEPEVPPDPAAPAQRVQASSYRLEIQTGGRGTWGRVWVTLITENGSRFEIFSKSSVNDRGGLIPNFNADPELNTLVLQENTAKTVNVSVTAALDFDLRTLRSVQVEWQESNVGDAWGFKGISLSADTPDGETIPVLINDMEMYVQSPAIKSFSTSWGSRQNWTGSARVAEPAAAPAPAAARKRPATVPRSAPEVPRAPGRANLDVTNPVDWDTTPTFYEATTIAHGHLLHFKQVWYADGYSLGDLLYSLPLAPGQKKLISVIDWERRERTDRSEATLGSEELQAALSRDRDLGEVVSGALTEMQRGGSRNTTVGVGAGTGAAGNGSYQQFNFGALLGVSGGYGQSDSNAWTDSARSVSSNSLQTLHDNTLQSASAVRGIRSSIVHAVGQGETARATTEVVANHNHCHAITVQYFEVLRHLKLVHELADVQECLLVPLPMGEFDLPKLLRWAQPLRTYLQRPDLDGGFDAARRVATEWREVVTPKNTYADEAVTSISGELLVTVIIPLPPFPERPRPRPEDTVEEAAARAKAVSEAVNPTSGPMGIFLGIISGGATLIAGAATNAAINATKEAAAAGARALADELYNQPTAQERYDKFHHEIMPAVVEGFIDQFEVYALVKGREVRLNGVDFTLVSEYQPAKPLLVSLRGTIQGQIPRADITQLIIRSPKGLPPGCRAVVNSANVRYRTRLYEHLLIDDNRVNDDIDLPKVVPVFGATAPFDMTVKELAPGMGAALFTPTDEWEQRSPRTEDRRLTAQLIDHLNDNLEFYHHAVWWTMNPSRRFMLLDGYFAPGSGDRSVASVVENRLIGIIGNSLVLPVARGVRLNPRFRPGAKGEAADLLAFYQLDPPLAPSRVSLPTRGVFAEAVMGSCNACEEIDDSKFWRWQESPIDEPPTIEGTSTATRRSVPDSGLPTPFPTPIVSIQAAPGVPDPTGVRAVLDTLTRQSFADVAGLAGTQANAAAAYSKALDTALQFGKEASTLAQQAAMLKSLDKTMGTIDKAESGQKIPTAKAQDLRVTALKKAIGDTSANGMDAAEIQKQLDVISKTDLDGGLQPQVAQALNRDLLKQMVDAGGGTGARAVSDFAGLERSRVEKLISTGPDGTGEVHLTPAVYRPGGSGALPLGSTAAQQAYQAVADLTTRFPSPSGDDFFDAVDKLRALGWDELWAVLESLARQGPGLETMTWLELFHERAATMTSVDARVLAATKAVLIARGGRTIKGSEGLEQVGSLAQLLIQLPGIDQLRIMSRLGLRDEAAEGAIAAMFGAAIDAGMAVAPMAANIAFDFGDWNLPGGMSVPNYIGIQAHVGIAAHYMTKHLPPAHLVATNYQPIQSIVNSLVQQFGFSPGSIAAKLQGRMPDIFEFSLEHVPPGLVYEIKPWWLAEVAAAETAMYCAGLTQAGVPAVPGPIGFAGTFGAIPAPNGYFVFESPLPGVIAYQYLQASPAEIRARDQQRNTTSPKKMDLAVLQAAGLTLAGAVLAAALVEMLVAAGWVLALA